MRTGRLVSTSRLIGKNASTKRPSNDLDGLVLIEFQPRFTYISSSRRDASFRIDREYADYGFSD
ncbi:hypothetical protein [Bacillus atrophaeus]|uniref:hypothetical protein n=1 Tax=Bacillus atrophaeus TaxID=1452 RepID=UPI003D25BDC8